MKYRCFVIIPYREEYTPIHDAIVRSAQRLDTGEEIEFIRADREALAPIPELNIERHISLCDLAIADVSNDNPNVLYEVGYAAALGKPVILLMDRSKETPLTLSGRNLIRYDRRDLSSLTAQLPSFVSVVLHSPQRKPFADTFVVRGYVTEFSADLSLLVRHARLRIDSMVANLSQVVASGLLRDMVKAIDRSEDLRVRVMALDPDSIIVGIRARELVLPVGQYRAELRAAIDQASAEFANVCDRFSLRLFDGLPYYNVFRIDDVVFLGLLVGYSRSRSGLTFKLSASDSGVDSILNTFEATWQHSVEPWWPNKRLQADGPSACR